METGFEKNLVGINIADSGDEILIEEKRLDAAAPTLEKLKKSGPAYLQGLRTEALEFSRALRL
jgi:hypothetical protein